MQGSLAPVKGQGWELEVQASCAPSSEKSGSRQTETRNAAPHPPSSSTAGTNDLSCLAQAFLIGCAALSPCLDKGACSQETRPHETRQFQSHQALCVPSCASLTKEEPIPNAIITPSAPSYPWMVPLLFKNRLKTFVVQQLWGLQSHPPPQKKMP